jgi:hypothetical protein
MRAPTPTHFPICFLPGRESLIHSERTRLMDTTTTTVHNLRLEGVNGFYNVQLHGEELAYEESADLTLYRTTSERVLVYSGATLHGFDEAGTHPAIELTSVDEFANAAPEFWVALHKALGADNPVVVVD